jgi:hypothetical protein
MSLDDLAFWIGRASLFLIVIIGIMLLWDDENK